MIRLMLSDRPFGVSAPPQHSIPSPMRMLRYQEFCTVFNNSIYLLHPKFGSAKSAHLALGEFRRSVPQVTMILVGDPLFR